VWCSLLLLLLLLLRLLLDAAVAAFAESDATNKTRADCCRM